MKCHYCSNPATVHLTDLVKKQKKELHLCQACAEQQQLIQHNELNLTTIVQTLLGQHVGHLPDELARLTCPQCGIKFMEFRAEGRLGCPHDYEVFKGELQKLLERIHRAGRHVGKVPRRRPVEPAEVAELVALRKQLRESVEAEAYEQAARLRDRIRQKESHG
jgi:protein arginine kinase activator